jgi:copper chaperone CopZ
MRDWLHQESQSGAKCENLKNVSATPNRIVPHHIDMAIETVRLSVQGMTCGNCARGVERKLMGTGGVNKVMVDLDGGSATVEFDDAKVKPEDLAKAVRQLGYEVPA